MEYHSLQNVLNTILALGSVGIAIGFGRMVYLKKFNFILTAWAILLLLVQFQAVISFSTEPLSSPVSTWLALIVLVIGFSWTLLGIILFAFTDEINLNLHYIKVKPYLFIIAATSAILNAVVQIGAGLENVASTENIVRFLMAGTLIFFGLERHSDEDNLLFHYAFVVILTALFVVVFLVNYPMTGTAVTK